MESIKARVLLVEDDANLGFILKDYLEMIGYLVDLQDNGQKGYEAFIKGKFDICILDVMMPVKDGFTLADEIRAKSDVPIVFLTAKGLKQDRIKGLKKGADDFITKPFSTEELSLRMDAILRRYRNSSAIAKDKTFEFGQFKFNYGDQVLEFDKTKKHLTKREADVLRILAEHKNRLVKRGYVLKTIWGEDDYFMGRSMDVYITKLRKYLKKDEKVNIINIHGSGFKLDVQE